MIKMKIYKKYNVKIIEQVGKNITGLDYPMFLCELEDGETIYLPETLINRSNYIQLSLLDLLDF